MVRRRRSFHDPTVLMIPAGAAIGALVFFALLTPPPAATVHVSGAVWTIAQGLRSNGLPWFGQWTINQTGFFNGFPLNVSPGTHLHLTVFLLNYDAVNHTIYSINVSEAGASYVGTYPVLPAEIGFGEDESVIIYIAITAPARTSLTIDGTINALGF